MMFSMIDYSALVIIALFAFFGFLRGVISQIMAIVGFAGVFLFAKPFSEKLDVHVVEFLGSPKPYAKTIALLWAAFIIYVGCRLFGYFIEKIFIKQSTPLKSINRIGGGFLGAIKGLCIVIVVFYLLYLIPREILDKSAPKVRQSRIYQLMATHPVFERSYLESLMSPISRTTQDQIQSLMKTEDPAFFKQMQNAQKAESKMNEKELLDELNSHLEAPAKQPKKKTNP